MSIPLFDVQTGFGGPAPGQCDVVHAGELVAEMAREDYRTARRDDLIEQHGYKSYNYHE